jgi:hypothetical protein
MHHVTIEEFRPKYWVCRSHKTHYVLNTNKLFDLNGFIVSAKSSREMIGKLKQFYKNAKKVRSLVYEIPDIQ